MIVAIHFRKNFLSLTVKEEEEENQERGEHDDHDDEREQ